MDEIFQNISELDNFLICLEQLRQNYLNMHRVGFPCNNAMIIIGIKGLRINIKMIEMKSNSAIDIENEDWWNFSTLHKNRNKQFKEKFTYMSPTELYYKKTEWPHFPNKLTWFRPEITTLDDPNRTVFKGTSWNFEDEPETELLLSAANWYLQPSSVGRYCSDLNLPFHFKESKLLKRKTYFSQGRTIHHKYTRSFKYLWGFRFPKIRQSSQKTAFHMWSSWSFNKKRYYAILILRQHRNSLPAKRAEICRRFNYHNWEWAQKWVEFGGSKNILDLPKPKNKQN